MVAITTPPANSLLSRIIHDYSQFTFHHGERFEWRPNEATIYYSDAEPHFDERLLHELSHAILDHRNYDRDIDLIALERDAWAYARQTLCPKYAITISPSVIEADMDTYRDWLHARSTCPKCSSTGLQIEKNGYRCVSCTHIWRVNEARLCQLKRYSKESKYPSF